MRWRPRTTVLSRAAHPLRLRDIPSATKQDLQAEGSKTKPATESDAATIPPGGARAGVCIRREIAANSAAEGLSVAYQATGTSFNDARNTGKPILEPTLTARYGAGKGRLSFLYLAPSASSVSVQKMLLRNEPDSIPTTTGKCGANVLPSTRSLS